MILGFLPPVLLGLFTISLLMGNLLLWTAPVYTVIIARIVVPISSWQRTCSRFLERMAEYWSKGNEYILWLTQKTVWDVKGIEGLRRKECYLVNCNHQSAVDIFVLQKIFNRRIPYPKYFLKRELLWIPILGPIWWALEYPFMKRFSRAYLEKHPEKLGQDLETTKRLCERYKTKQVTILNFLEGTRFTERKHEQQASPYRHLLKPKAGGIALIIHLLQEHLQSILDVTIVYPDKPISLWKFFSGQISKIIVRVEHLNLGVHLIEGDYQKDPNYRAYFQNWVQHLWQKKDDLIEELVNSIPFRGTMSHIRAPESANAFNPLTRHSSDAQSGSEGHQ
ncbi:acyltransferase [bacterium]|nr:acyltransferase [bacterium]